MSLLADRGLTFAEYGAKIKEESTSGREAHSTPVLVEPRASLRLVLRPDSCSLGPTEGLWKYYMHSLHQDRQIWPRLQVWLAHDRGMKAPMGWGRGVHATSSTTVRPPLDSGSVDRRGRLA